MAGGEASARPPGYGRVFLGAALLAALACAALAAPARAGGRVTEPYPEPPSDSVLIARGLPSPSVAQERSAYSTLIPLTIGAGAIVADVTMQGEGYLAVAGVVLASGGIVFGPVVGYAYGNAGGRGAVGVVLRLGLVVGVPIGAYMSTEGGDEEAMWATAGGFLLGNALALGSAIVDIVAVRGVVEKKNREHAGPARVSFGPAVAPFSHAPGFAVSVPLGSGAR